jgi:hypothetical protein
MAGWQASSEEILNYIPMRKGEIETHLIAAGEGWDLLGWRPRYDMWMVSEAVQTYKP